jgi:DNA methyltransferase 1-associated protein 1
MHRELYNLLVQDHGKDVSPLMPTLVDTATSGGYRNPKAKIGLHRARHWQLVEFDHPVKPDRLRLTHWQRSDRIDQPYPFARFNKVV